MKQVYDKFRDSEELQGIEEITGEVVKRIRNDSDYVICITGLPGSGKSSLEIWLGCFINAKSQMDLDLKANIAYIPDPQEVIRQFNALNKYSAFLVDEAVKGFHKHQWANKFQQMLTQMYNTERWQNKVSILVIPRFKDLSEYFRNERVSMWIDVIERGTAVVYVKDIDSHIGAEDPWHMKENFKIKQKYFRGQVFAPNEIRLKAASECMGYWGLLNWPKLPKEIEKDYNRLKIESRKLEQEMNKEVEEEKIGILDQKRLRTLATIVRYLIKQEGWTMAKLEKITGVNHGQFSGWLQWVESRESGNSISINLTDQGPNTHTLSDYLTILHKGQLTEKKDDQNKDSEIKPLEESKLENESEVPEETEVKS